MAEINHYYITYKLTPRNAHSWWTGNISTIYLSSLSRSLTKNKKFLKTKYGILDISSTIFTLLLFVGIFSQTLIWWTAAQVTPGIL